MSSDYLSESEIAGLGFKSTGTNIKISRSCIFFNCHLIEIGKNVRIDANTVITANKESVKIGSYVHIGVGCYVNGSFGLELRDFTALSAGTKLFSSSDDYSGNYMTNPTVPSAFTNPTNGKVVIGKFVNIGSNCVIMPNVEIGEGSVVGALSFVNKSIRSWGIYFGSPVKRIGDRKKNVLELSLSLIHI